MNSQEKVILRRGGAGLVKRIKQAGGRQIVQQVCAAAKRIQRVTQNGRVVVAWGHNRRTHRHQFRALAYCVCLVL